MPRPAATDAAEPFHRYINYAQGNSVKEILANHSKALVDYYSNLPEDKAGYAYAGGKWTVKQVLQHVIDAERVFTYRALRIARKDTTPMPRFDENLWAENAQTENRTFQSLKDEFIALHTATDILFSTMNEDQFSAAGTSGNHYITANALAFVTYGHALHHKSILEERYF